MQFHDKISAISQKETRHGQLYRQRSPRHRGEKSKTHPLSAGYPAPDLCEGRMQRGCCGTCHVLIDGKPTKACVPQTEKLEGKTIVTVEGLSDWEKQVYVFAFGEAGAVQCGFASRHGHLCQGAAGCKPRPHPVRRRPRHPQHICRCTGYVKIIDGILLAGVKFSGREAAAARRR